VTLRLNLTLVVAAAAALLFSVSSASASAQTTRTSLRGRVVDPLHEPVADARITALRDGEEAHVATSTDRNGEFNLPLEPGAYVLTVAVEGFNEASLRVVVAAGGVTHTDFVLELPAYTQAVEVTGNSDRNTGTINSSTRTPTPLRDVPQSVTIVSSGLIRDQLMASVADTVNYIPGVTSHQGENNRDQIVIRGNSSSADFYVNGVRDDVQYYRDLYNVERVEALKGPNGMVFGRGGGGGVINRVTKQAGFTRTGETMLQAGSFGHRRLTADLNQPLTARAAFRVNGVFEDSDSFRHGVGLQRYGVAPSLTFMHSDRTALTLDYEHFHDERVADRGITSYHGRPADVPIGTFFGNVTDSHVHADIDVASLGLEHHVGQFTIRNRSVAGNYDRGYQNYVPGSVSNDRAQVALSAYNNATGRLNVFNQTDVIRIAKTGRIRHTVLAGGEIGRQRSRNFRNTGYFDDVATTVFVPFSSPATSAPMTYRQNAADANNRVRTNLGALYVQDQAELSRRVQLIGGVRFDRFDLQFHNRRTSETLSRVDHLVSPRTGVVVKPIAAASIYASYSLSYLPSSGDQFSSLTAITQQMKPERFTNYEVGAKWDAAEDLSVTTALYRLDRTNTRATDPEDPTRIVQTGSQRTDGYEIGLTAASPAAGRSRVAMRIRTRL
jgi:catecholate siderophore receptor